MRDYAKEDFLATGTREIVRTLFIQVMGGSKDLTAQNRKKKKDAKVCFFALFAVNKFFCEAVSYDGNPQYS